MGWFLSYFILESSLKINQTCFTKPQLLSPTIHVFTASTLKDGLDRARVCIAFHEYT